MTEFEFDSEKWESGLRSAREGSSPRSSTPVPEWGPVEHEETLDALDSAHGYLEDALNWATDLKDDEIATELTKLQRRIDRLKRVLEER